MIRPWRIRVRRGTPAPGGLAFVGEDVFYLVYRCWTKGGAWRRADRWKADYERRRSGYQVHPAPVLVDVVHVSEIPS